MRKRTLLLLALAACPSGPRGPRGPPRPPLVDAQRCNECDGRCKTSPRGAADRNVPVILLPFGRTPHEPLTAPTAEMSRADVAPLVLQWLGATATR